MGRKQSFCCNVCGYKASQIGGGLDTGFRVMKQTYACGKCKTLLDLIVANRSDSPSAPWVYQSVKCPRDWRGRKTSKLHSTESEHILEKWEHPGPCPKCEGTMEIDGDDGGILWD